MPHVGAASMCLLAVSAWSAARVSKAYTCDVVYSDQCNGTGAATRRGLVAARPGAPRNRGGCTPYAPPLDEGTDWLDIRRRLINEFFGVGDGRLPAQRAPNYTRTTLREQVFGNCVCATRGLCPPASCARKVPLTELVWTVEVPVNASFTLALNATGFHSLRTSGVAVNNGPAQGPPEWPGDPREATAPGDTLVIFHNGHARPCNVCDPDFDGTIDWLNRLGYDTLALQMPLFQCNYVARLGCKHRRFEEFRRQGAKTLRFFLEPVVLAVNYAREVLGYQRIVLAGLSGGGWTTTVVSAIDPRIGLSFPVAGSIPCDFEHTSWDFEQYCDSSWAMIANYTSLYALAALEPTRYSVQLLHEGDPCCFHGCHRHERIRRYNAWVQAQTGGRFATAVTAGNLHEVNERDKVIIASLTDRLRLVGRLTAADLASIPFNLLVEAPPPPEPLLA